MKKKTIVGLTLLSSLFIIVICGTLGTYLLIGNNYGINIADDGLFPSVEVTTLNEGEFPNDEYSQYIDTYFEQNAIVTFKNETSQPLTIDLEKYVSADSVKYSSLSGYVSSNLYIDQIDEYIYSIKEVPDNYEYYLLSSDMFTRDEDSYVSLQLAYDGATLNFDETENVNTKTLESGDSYEIKLS